MATIVLTTTEDASCTKFLCFQLNSTGDKITAAGVRTLDELKGTFKLNLKSSIADSDTDSEDYCSASAVADYIKTKLGPLNYGFNIPSWKGSWTASSDGTTLTCAYKVRANLYFSSDEKLKKDIVEDSDDIILKLEPIKYKLRRDDSSHLGFIAQDLQKLDDRLVNTSGEYLSINTPSLVSKLFLAVNNL